MLNFRLNGIMSTKGYKDIHEQSYLKFCCSSIFSLHILYNISLFCLENLLKIILYMNAISINIPR